MSETDYFSPERKKARSAERVRNYGLALALTLIFGFSGFQCGDPANLIAMKLLAVPVFVMALGFLPLQFNSEQARTPWTLANIEMLALFGILIASITAIIGWQPDINVGVMVRNFLFVAISFPIAIVIAIHFVSKWFPDEKN